MNKLTISKPNKPDAKTEAAELKGNSTKNYGSIIMIIAIIIIGVLSAYFASGILGKGAEALKESYNSAYSSEKDSAYQKQYQKYYEKAEENYHVANRVSISIGDLKEKAALEVLKVFDTEYIIENSNDNQNNIDSWLEVPGEGTYIVDLQTAEFIVDAERSYVLVRAPHPELTNIAIDYANVKKLLFKNDVFNDSISVGEDLARQQLNAADLRIKKEFASNQHFYLSAQDAAVSTIQCLVRQFNPDVPDLMVEVEFY